MPPVLHTLQNDYWQVGILPETGASIAFGRVKKDGQWVDVMRPTDPADYDNASNCASFVLSPWSNRIREGRLRFRGNEYPLEVNNADGTAIHGDTRGRIWQVEAAGESRINLSFDSTAHANINFPWQFAACAEYWLDGPEFVMSMGIKNLDDESFPGGFGQHPYFVLTDDTMLEVPVDQQYNLTDAMPDGGAVPISATLDFRTMRALRDAPPLDNLFRGRQGDKPARIVYPAHDIEVGMYADPIFEHFIVYAPPGQPFFAVEPVTNANDGFNLFEQGVAGNGVFVLEPGDDRHGAIRLRYEGS
jgi:aldose 1-epimerase